MIMYHNSGDEGSRTLAGEPESRCARGLLTTSREGTNRESKSVATVAALFALVLSAMIVYALLYNALIASLNQALARNTCQLTILQGQKQTSGGGGQTAGN